MEINISGIFFPAQDIFCKIEYKKGYSCFCSPGEKNTHRGRKGSHVRNRVKKYFSRRMFFPRMRKRKIACKEPSELKIFQEIFSFFVNRTKKPHK